MRLPKLSWFLDCFLKIVGLYIKVEWCFIDALEALAAAFIEVLNNNFF